MPEKTLVAFDFDHTIIDDNSDLYVRKLAPNGQVPKHIKDLYSENGWTEYMGAIFRYLYETGISPNQMLNCMKEIPLVKGMDNLFSLLQGDAYEGIIISDSNSTFIDCILKDKHLNGAIDKVYTNPATFDKKGCLNIDYYHTQDWCDLSTINLCKGHILEDHIKTRRAEGTVYKRIAYVGDGSNDLCPSLKLGEQDLIFAREGYRLIKKINKGEHPLKAKVVVWGHGDDIYQELKPS